MNATHALGWALVHFVWQGAALAVLLGIGLAVTPATAARTRYALSLLALCAMLALPIATGLRLLRSEPTPASAAYTAPEPTEPNQPRQVSPAPLRQRVSVTAPGPANPRGAGASVARLRGALEPALGWLVVVWVAGVLALSLRLGRGWMAARRLRTEATRDVSAALEQMLARLAARLRLTRAVRLVESLMIEVPAVIGWLRPVILLPTTALTGLTPQQLEVLIAHELAHVRRYDYLVNVLQCVIETLLFYHPAVWWVSRRVRDEREHCCDDLVVQLCGNADLYASALVTMERLRITTPRLALAATDGSLLQRVRRLLVPKTVRAELFPRWAAGVAGIMAVTVALLATGSDRLAGASASQIVADTTRLTPDTVLRHPDQSQPLAQRWEWARTQARQLSRRAYWVGYTIPRPAWLDHAVYVDRGMEVTGRGGIKLSGQLFGDFQSGGFMFRGVRLAPLTGAGDSDDIALLFGFTLDQGGKPTLTHIHVASAYLPMDFRGRPLLWLGAATDAQSLPVVEGLFATAPRPELREDVVAAIGVHGSSDAVVPILVRLLKSTEPTDVRAQAAEWLGFHPVPAAVSALSAAARGDVAGDVRRQAAQALANNMLPAALDSTIALARTAEDADTRREAIEGIGQKDSDRVLATLTSIAQADRSEDVQRVAVEALGEMPGGRGLNAIRDVARNHPRGEIRRQAVETLGDKLPPAEAIPLLKSLAVDDRDVDVQQAAVEKLGELHDDRAYNLLVDLARTHPSSDVRRKAIETLGESGHKDSVIAVLGDLARRTEDPDAAGAALETLGELHDARALAVVARIARTPGNVDVRQKAIETYAEAASRDSAVALFKAVLANDPPEDVYNRVLEELEEMKGGAGIPLLIEIARSHPNSDIRADALRRLAESDDPRAQKVFDQTLRRP
jgi:beta-lactamase regulating signal transducer with metallopeptidase domain/HEAT repeat protein